MVTMDTVMLLLLLCLGCLTDSAADDSTQAPTTQLPPPSSATNTNTAATTGDQSDTAGQAKTTDAQGQAKTTASANVPTAPKLTTDKPVLTTAPSVLPDTTKPSSNEPSTEAHKTDAPMSTKQTTKRVPTSTKQNTSSAAPVTEKPQTVVPVTEVTESVIVSTEKISNKSEDITTAASTDINATDANDVTETTLPPGLYPDDWLHVFLRVHHFEGQYMYDGGAYLFDFVARNVHPLSTRTLVALFYDEEGAILEMNGTSTDGHHITFVLNKIYTAGYRFPAGMQLELTGTLSGGGEHRGTSYDGNISKPVNSSFQTFHMNKGLGVVETGDAAGTRTAIIVVVPVSIAFLGIIATVTVLCWASKKGMLKGRHRSYQLFQDTPVVFESEAETIHI